MAGGQYFIAKRFLELAYLWNLTTQYFRHFLDVFNFFHHSGCYFFLELFFTPYRLILNVKSPTVTTLSVRPSDPWKTGELDNGRESKWEQNNEGCDKFDNILILMESFVPNKAKATGPIEVVASIGVEKGIIH